MDYAVLIARLVFLGIYCWLFWAIYSSYGQTTGKRKVWAILNAAAGAAVFTGLIVVGIVIQS